MIKWIVENSTAITIWCGAISTFAIYSILYGENKLYRFFEHVFIGLATGYGIYITWSQVMGPMWWTPMVKNGQWYWAFAAVAGSMFYFMYSRKHVWISRIIFGIFMGLAAGGMFRQFYALYFPQMRASMQAIYKPGMTVWGSADVIISYIILFASMSYFFFSFEHKHPAVTRTAAAGRWFLMIGFGAIFGATVMGRMTLFIGRFNFLLNQWRPQVCASCGSPVGRIVFVVAIIALAVWAIATISKRNRANPPGNSETSS